MVYKDSISLWHKHDNSIFWALPSSSPHRISCRIVLWNASVRMQFVTWLTGQRKVKHLPLIWSEIIIIKKERTGRPQRKCILLRFSFGGITSLPADDDTLVSHAGKRIIFQWKPKPYCWECTIWISKGSTPTSIFSGITRESARGGKTDWWWIMYILLANCDICLATSCCIRHTPKSSFRACDHFKALYNQIWYLEKYRFFSSSHPQKYWLQKVNFCRFQNRFRSKAVKKRVNILMPFDASLFVADAHACKAHYV